MRRTLTLVILVVSTVSLSAETPLQEFLHARRYKTRLNPGAFSLVGDLYPDKDQIGAGRLYTLKECFSDMSLYEEDLDRYTEVLSYRTSDVSLLLKIAKSNPNNSLSDLENLETAFTKNHVSFVSLKATNLVHVHISTGPLADEAPKSRCANALLKQRNFLVTDALGAETLSYDFLDNRRTTLSASASKLLAPLLFKVGLSSSKDTIGSASFTKRPVFIGFAISRWDSNRHQFQLVR